MSEVDVEVAAIVSLPPSALLPALSSSSSSSMLS